ncbi:Uma2 family endonuclease [Crocosphaera chwakensis]|uniref:Putative restriction endonuclease domain-containing protein n=1 Tax=Crocosphaera chwakensis CCY0110 TaxID=391612 RepID=A3IPW2_9CHRO|nr:Uma2 family endonuclease [Crocosphaera chwakensis]EAZ91602.1 hypothetical protein CY0110_13816 [Crocosphaera chwakensis CCY0110]
METITIPKGFKITPQQFDQLANIDQQVRMELTQEGELIIMSPTGGEAGRKNRRLIQQIGIWTDQNGTGECFDSSTLFILPNGARRSPDVSWIKLERWNTLTLKEKQGFPPISPDFVIELVSPSERCDPASSHGARERAPRLKNQRYSDLQLKMQEYLENGVKLGWLIEPSAKIVEIYRLGQEKEILNHPQTLSGENTLPGFIAIPIVMRYSSSNE